MSNSNDVISIVVPIYNVGDYLRVAIESILAQTYTNIEILLIDDGSTDSSGDIADEYAALDSRIQVFHTENRGLSCARNLGIEKSMGEFITFIDSDDALDPLFCERMLRALKSKNADVVVCDYARFKELIPQRNEKESGAIESFYSLNALRQFMTDNKQEPVRTIVAWGKIWRRKAFSDVRFPANVGHEDSYVIHHLLGNVERVIYLNDILYYYRDNPNSVTAKPFNEKKMDLVYSMEDMLLFCYDKVEKDLITQIEKMFLNCYIRVVNELYQNEKLTKKEQKKYYKTLQYRVYSVEKRYRIFNSLPTRNMKIRYFLFKINPRLYFYLFNKFNVYYYL